MSSPRWLCHHIVHARCRNRTYSHTLTRVPAANATTAGSAYSASSALPGASRWWAKCSTKLVRT
eukprot:3328836-Amphidinium_carterae.1